LQVTKKSGFLQKDREWLFSWNEWRQVAEDTPNHILFHFLERECCHIKGLFHQIPKFLPFLHYSYIPSQEIPCVFCETKIFHY
jgi:hypothetical protein